MLFIRAVNIHEALTHAGVRAVFAHNHLIPPGSPWLLATPVRDEGTDVHDSRLFKSLKDECDDIPKRKSLVDIFTALQHAVEESDYQKALKQTPGISVKEAHSFTAYSSKHKVWEIKHQKKNRLYFFPLHLKDSQFLLPLTFHHKDQQQTPPQISNFCETVMKDFLQPKVVVKILK